MIITKIERRTHHPEKANLYIDGKFIFKLHQEVLTKFGIREGDQLSQDEIDKIITAEEFNLAKQKSLSLINRRLRTERELRLYLRKKEFHPDIIEQVITHLQSKNIVNDEHFARIFVHDAQLLNPSGKKFIQRQLFLKGVSSSIIRDVLEQEIDPDIERENALDAAKKMLHRYRTSRKRIEKIKQKQRLTQYLARRGFDWSTISHVSQKLFPK